MKVELEDVQINFSSLTDEVFLGVAEKNRPHMWKHKKNVTSNFIACLIARNKGQVHTVTDQDGKSYEITVKELTK